MIRNYFRVAWRNLARNKSFSVINIAGLSIGMVCTMLIALWIYAELSWDKNNANYDTTYHVMSTRNFNGELTTGPDLMYPLAKESKTVFPDVAYAAVVSFGENTLFSKDDKQLNKNTITVSPDFFNIFSFNFIKGNAAAINDPDAIIITAATAKALFNNTDIIGQPVRINNGRTAYVKAVLEDVPKNSTLQFDGIIPFNPSSPEIVRASNEWVNCGNRIFFKTKEGANTAALEKKVLQLIKEKAPSENPTTRGSITLHPMSKWRLYEEFRDGKNTGGRIQYVNLFVWIAIVILIIACVNFMNLSTARSEKRAKEVGIRKTLGSQKQQLVLQFLAESILLAFIAFLLAVLMVYLFLPSFSRLLNIEISIPYSDPFLWTLAGGIILLTGFVAGVYPAFFLSKFRPVKVLKGAVTQSGQALLPRKILVVSQFIASIILISATIIIYQQLQHVKSRDLGYDPDNLIMINSSADADKSFAALKNDLLQTGKVASVVRTSSPVTTILGFTSGVKWTGAPENTDLVIGFLFTEEDFAKTLNAKMIEGRDFRMGDSNAVIFNKEAIRLMGLKNPVGTEITWAGRKRTIVGVIDNLVMTSPYEAASPLMASYESRWSRNINVRLAQHADVRQSMTAIESIYKKYSASYPFEFRFVDEEFNRKFDNEQLIGTLSVIFAGLAIFVCCLGLFGLVSFSIERRKKEIGVRKVLGASVQQVLLLMSKEFLWLVALAFIVAIPAARWIMNDWLQNFNYRIYIQPGVFVLVGLLIVVIALITVSLNAGSAALKNPVKTLRSE